MRGIGTGPGSSDRFRECAERRSVSSPSQFRSLTDLSNGAQSGERAAHHLGRPHAIGVVGGLGFQQLGVRQEDPELVIQAVKQRLKLAVLRLVGLGPSKVG